MLGGPNSGLTATISVPAAAAAAAALAMVRVIDAVVFGLITSIRICKFTCLEFASQIEVLHALVVCEGCGVPGERHRSGRQDVGPLRDAQRHAGVLLDQQHADVFVAVDG